MRNKKKAAAAEANADEKGKKKAAGGKNATGKNAGAKKARGSARTEYETVYCYNEEERIAAVQRLSPNPEITRFKGLGEISADEFKNFIGPDMRLEPVTLHKSDKVKELLAYYMGKNTMERQNFIIDNLVIEEDIVDETTE